MSEKQSNLINTELPEDLEQYENLDMMTYGNGARHVYGVDDEGKRHHISHDDVLSAYGYESREQEEANSGDPVDVIGDDEDPESPEDPGYDVLDPVPPTPEDDGDGEVDETEETLARMETNLTMAEHEYAKRTAKARKSYFGRFCQGKTRLGKAIMKVPVVGKLTEILNNNTDTKTAEAKNEYERQFNELGAKIAEGLRAMGYSEEQVVSLSATGVIMRSQRLNEMILTERKMQSKDTNKFVNWWVNSKGIKGKLKKVGVVAGAGLLAGVTAGAVLPAYAGILAGGAAGGGIARHVTRRRANSVNENGRSLASVQASQDQKKSHQFAYEDFQADEFARVGDITDRVEYRTDDEMLGNRRRMKAAVAIGKLTGGIGGVLSGGLRDALEGDAQSRPSTPEDTPAEPDTPDAGAEQLPEAEPAEPISAPYGETLQGQEFYVEPGHGFTHEIQQFAEVNGTQIDGTRANEIYNEAIARFGQDGLINDLGTYNRPQGDVGILSPGQASWKPGVAEFLKTKLQ